MAAAGLTSGGGDDSNNELKWCACRQNMMPFGVCILVIKYFTPEKKRENKVVCDQVRCRLCVAHAANMSAFYAQTHRRKQAGMRVNRVKFGEEIEERTIKNVNESKQIARAGQ